MEEIARAAEAAAHAQTHAASSAGMLPAGAEDEGEGALGEAWLRDVPGGGSAAVAALRAAHIRPPSPSPSSALLALLSSSSPSSQQPQLGPQMDRLQAEFQAAVAPLAAEVDGAVARIRELEARKARLAAELAQVDADQVRGSGPGPLHTLVVLLTSLVCFPVACAVAGSCVCCVVRARRWRACRRCRRAWRGRAPPTTPRSPRCSRPPPLRWPLPCPPPDMPRGRKRRRWRRRWLTACRRCWRRCGGRTAASHAPCSRPPPPLPLPPTLKEGG
jgi:hypothetical protein